jgi:hemoglobin
MRSSSTSGPPVIEPARMTEPWAPTPVDTPFDHLGEEAARRLASRFYDFVDEREPALARAHRTDEHGRVHPEARHRFEEFLVEWLGGPARYSPRYGHPRLRMRHGGVAIDRAQRDAWLRCMSAALDEVVLDVDVRAYLARRFAEVADFLRNHEG